MLARNRAAATALLVAVVALSALAVVRHDADRLRAYFEVVGALVALTIWADRAAHFSRALVAALTSVAILHLVGGLMTPVGDAPTFYETWIVNGVLKFDQVVHAYGTAVLTVACARLVVGLLGPVVRRGAGLAFVAALMACGLGALNELVEFLFGLNNAHLHAGGMENTGWDLAFNLLGAAIGAVLLVSTTHDEHDAGHAGRADAGLRGLRAGRRRAGAVVSRRAG
ncbi:MAG TPA: hypothetical protein VHC63_08405 [Acidimicrobiales bacterium]|nr:hypothetical protein [Acidimicrobiales bacterium]